MARGTKKKKEPRVIPGTSDYVVRENAARKQLGVAGLAARNKQVPTAARAFTKEMTGIDISRKGVSVDPFGVAMALPVGKVLKAAKALRAAGKIGQASALEARAAANTAGKYCGGTGKKSQGLGLPMDRAVDVGGKARMASESLYPKLPSMGGVPGAKRTFDKYADPLLEGPGRSYGRDDLNDFVYDAVKLGKFRKVGKAAAAAKKSGGR